MSICVVMTINNKNLWHILDILILYSRSFYLHIIIAKNTNYCMLYFVLYFTIVFYLTFLEDCTISVHKRLLSHRHILLCFDEYIIVSLTAHREPKRAHNMDVT